MKSTVKLKKKNFLGKLARILVTLNEVIILLLVFKHLMLWQEYFQEHNFKSSFEWCLKKKPQNLVKALKIIIRHIWCLNYETFMSLFYWKRFLMQMQHIFSTLKLISQVKKTKQRWEKKKKKSSVLWSCQENNKNAATLSIWWAHWGWAERESRRSLFCLLIYFYCRHP